MAIPPIKARIEVTGIMTHDPNPIPVGSQGTVTGGDENSGQIYVDWDDPQRSLILLMTDPYRVLPF